MHIFIVAVFICALDGYSDIPQALAFWWVKKQTDKYLKMWLIHKAPKPKKWTEYVKPKRPDFL